jgi:hypothetical protein
MSAQNEPFDAATKPNDDVAITVADDAAKKPDAKTGE